MSWEEHAEYVCTCKNGIERAQVFLCSAFTAVIGFPSGHTWSCLQGFQLFFCLPNLGLSFVFSPFRQMWGAIMLHLANLADVRHYHVGGLFFSYCGKEHVPQCLVEVGGQLCRLVLSFYFFVGSGAQAQVTRLAQQESRCVSPYIAILNFIPRARGVKGVSEDYRMTAWPTIQCLVTQIYQKQSPQCWFPETLPVQYFKISSL